MATVHGGSVKPFSGPVFTSPIFMTLIQAGSTLNNSGNNRSYTGSKSTSKFQKSLNNSERSEGSTEP
jgi:hypothetical protein